MEEGEEEEEKNIKESINYEFTSHVPEEDERFYTTHRVISDLGTDSTGAHNDHAQYIRASKNNT